MAPNLVLTGFMGTGKSSVGRLVAVRLGRELVDMDERLAERAGMSVAQIFAEQGEPAFREMENTLCRELAPRENLVIATGGGTLVNPVNRAALAASVVICLDAGADEILKRLDAATDRPLLTGDRRVRVEKLLAERTGAYAAIAQHVATNARTLDDVAREVLRCYQCAVGEVEELSVHSPEGAYPIWLGAGLLAQSGAWLAGLTRVARCAVVTNPTVARLHADALCASLRTEGLDPVLVTMPDGEACKNLDTLRSLYDQFAQARLERDSLVLALGGGVVGDVAGLAAATWLRGLPFVQVPTTLLAMVDASIGGKVAVDHATGKNLIGAYKFPRAVLADPALLETLPAAEYRSGLAEVVKAGIIGDPALFAALEQGPLDASMLGRSMRVKIALVEQDPFEQNVRAHLNLGHTFGHAIETLSDYRIGHGYAVAIGTACAARLAARTGLCDSAASARMIALLDRLQLPTTVPPEFSAEAIVQGMRRDKKVQSGRLRLVLPCAIGRVTVVDDIPAQAILDVLGASGAR